MKDFLGNEVAVGDQVVYMAPAYKRLDIGTVKKITEFGFTMEPATDKEWDKGVNRPAVMCIKYEGDNETI
jgi:hypothetical protein